MFYKFLSILFFISLSLLASGQPQPCTDPPTMTSICSDACVICDINGFMGRHDSNVPGVAPPGFAGNCTFVAHNMQWISFIAGSVDIQVELSVTNCQSGLGLEFGIYKGINCENLELVSNCFGAASQEATVGPGEIGIINNTEPLVIGQYYFMVMDGGQGDNCDWVFDVTQGSTAVPEVEMTGPIQGEFTSCPGLEKRYTTQAQFGATLYRWTVDGVSVGNDLDTFLDYTFPSDGTYTLCLQAANACDEALPICREIVVTSIPPTEIVDRFCEQDCYDVAGQTICESGDYSFTIPAANGCDSIINASLTKIPDAVTDIDVNICAGDTLWVAGTPYTTNGQFVEVTTTNEQCDSTINLDLFVIQCDIESINNENMVICHGGSTGSIEFSVTNGTPPFLYSWEQLGTTNTGSGNIGALNDNILISNLSAGTYIITIDDGFSNIDVIIEEVTEPEMIEITLTPKDFNGYGVECYNGANGELTATANGGMSPYFFTWSSGFSGPVLSNLSAGPYSVDVMDALGCTQSASIILTQPDQITADVIFNNATCDGLFTGTIEATNVNGGVPPYEFSLINGLFDPSPVFSDLGPDAYTLYIKDANEDCRESFSGLLTAPDIPNIDLGDDITINLGDSLMLNGNINSTMLDTIIWSTTQALSCDDCLDPMVKPFDTDTYTLQVISEDGCTDESQITITVEKNRKFYAPNAFTPNDDGFNDFFMINGSGEVLTYDLLIFDRWGNKLFTQEGITNSSPEDLGWDGQFKNQSLDPGVYSWLANITFIDGQTKNYSGSIALIK